MYRCIALLAASRDVQPGDEAALARCARSADITFTWEDGEQHVFLNGEDVTESIRTPAISQATSIISQVGAVRDAMVALQREMGRLGNVVMEGRDIGTVVFPDATIKVFLTASDRERAHRRALELQERTADGAPVDETRVLRELTERDTRDKQRKIAPLVPAPDAVMVNTDGLSIREVVDRIAALLPARPEGVSGD